MDSEELTIVLVTRKYKYYHQYREPSIIKFRFVHAILTLNGLHKRLFTKQIEAVSDDEEEEEGVMMWPGCEFNAARYVCHDLELLVFKINHKRAILLPPDNFRIFITGIIIPSFKKQCLRGNQFAVVVLLSENDLRNILGTTFVPSNDRRPLLDNDYGSMPQKATQYGNYIVARPISSSCHSEEEIFGKYSLNIPFSQLWSAYVKHNGSPPKCVLLYSWYLPCSRCTDVIIRSLNEDTYSCTSVIVAHTTYWQRESEDGHRKNTEKLKKENITVVQV